MALLFVDSLQQYASNETAMLDGPWAEIDISGFEFSLGSNGRSGTYNLNRSTTIGTVVARRVLGTSVTTVGLGFAFYPTVLPNFSNEVCLCDLRDANNMVNLSIVIQSTGVLSVVRGEVKYGTIIASSASPCVRAHSYQHVEIKATIDGSAGAVEVRVNGVTVISATGVDTVATTAEMDVSGKINGLAECSQVALVGGPNHGSTMNVSMNDYNIRYSDLVCWDDSGSYNNDFLGDHFVTAHYPTGDTAQADWTALSGTGYENIDDTDPDEDSTYIYAAAPGSPAESTSEFDIANLNSTSGTVAGVVVTTRARKDEAGDADLQNGVKSGGVETRGDTHAVNGIYTYYEDVVETDPNSGVAFTPTNINNLLLQLNRVT
jgi:hypothetical protein